MKNYISLAIVFLFLAGAPTVSFGEFYKYKDPNGVVRFTDNLAEVPPDQRPKVESYSEPEDFLTPAQKRQRESASSAQGKAPEKRPISEAEAAAEAETPEQQAARLREEKSRLEREYNEIMEAQNDLTARKKTLKSPASYRNFNKEQKRLRQRAEAYEKKREAFEQRVEAYNNTVSFPQPVE